METGFDITNVLGEMTCKDRLCRLMIPLWRSKPWQRVAEQDFIKGREIGKTEITSAKRWTGWKLPWLPGLQQLVRQCAFEMEMRLSLRQSLNEGGKIHVLGKQTNFVFRQLLDSPSFQLRCYPTRIPPAIEYAPDADQFAINPVVDRKRKPPGQHPMVSIHLAMKPAIQPQRLNIRNQRF